MQFELWHLFLVGVLYLGLLFVIATATDRGWIPESVASHPMVYTLSIGVYATSWSFYGSVGFADKQGFNFLTIYLGATLAFIASPILLRPILKITETYRLASLADLFAFRYHSQLAGVLVTLLVLAGTLPYISLQIQAVTNTLQIMTNETEQQLIALMFCITVGLFSILFGTRHISLREKHRGLVVAIAFESLVKLITLLSVGLFAVFGIFGGVDKLGEFLQQHPEATEALFAPVQEGPWATLMVLSFAAAFLLPRQFHMIFVESIRRKNIETASWAFPLFLLLLNLSIPPILWAGQTLQLSISPDFYVLGITLEHGSSVLPILTFMGGLSAASAMIIVTTLALASMCMNNFVLPASFPPKLSPGTTMYGWLLWGRRFVIMSIVGIGYIFYLIQEHNQGLAGLGLISFVAVAQCLPGIVGLLYWPRANKAGFISGLTVGALIWAFTLFIPLFERAGIIETLLFTIPELSMNTTDAALWSLLLNSLTFILVSLTSEQSLEEREVAKACSRESFLIPHGEVQAESISDFEHQLSHVIGYDIAHEEVNRALGDLGLVPGELGPRDLTRLRAQIDRNLSGLVGPVLSRMIVNEHLKIDSATQSALANTIQFVGHSQEKSRTELRGVSSQLDTLRRFHFQVLQDLPLGVVSIDDAGVITSWNKQFSKLTGVEQSDAVGKTIDKLDSPWSDLLAGFIDSEEFLISKLKVPIGQQVRVFNLFKAVVSRQRENHGGIAILIEDNSERYSFEQKLAHSERLASIGRLASGVAHEIGNPVTGIACLAQDLRNDLTDTTAANDGLNQILTQTERISRIVGSLSNYSHAGAADEYPAQQIDLRKVVDEAIHLVSLSHAGRQMSYANDCPGGVLINGFAQKMVQVFVNLLNNATDASEPGQIISIEFEQRRNQLIITVSDQGKGIADEHLPKIFEPFFTTKMVGEGTGLGLSLTYNIIQEHGGSITVSNRPGGGCRVEILLPGADTAMVTEA
jgi:Na+/proline symporter/nitrogen-specific signal transduction histidine kinase